MDFWSATNKLHRKIKLPVYLTSDVKWQMVNRLPAGTCSPAHLKCQFRISVSFAFYHFFAWVFERNFTK